MATYSEAYKCNECGNIWAHQWDTDDKNNDYTQCTKGCEEFDFDEISEDERKAILDAELVNTVTISHSKIKPITAVQLQVGKDCMTIEPVKNPVIDLLDKTIGALL